MNLSVPGDIDKLLSDLAQRVSMSRAALVMEAVREYLPEMRRKLSAQKWPGWEREKAKMAIEGSVPASRQVARAVERRRLKEVKRKVK